MAKVILTLTLLPLLAACGEKDHAVCYAFAWNAIIHCYPIPEQPAATPLQPD